MDYIAAISTLDEITQKQVKAFLDQVDPTGTNDGLRAIAFRALKGQAIETDAFEAYERAHEGDSPKQGQHPHFAYSGGSHPKGHESFFVGQNLVGETLSLRLPGAEWFDDEGKLLPEVKAFFALVVMKEIKHIIHARNDSSKMMEIACEYLKAGCHRGAPLPKSLAEVDPCLLSVTKSWGVAYEEVQSKGYDFYEKMGLSFTRASGSALSENEKLKLALSAQLLMSDVEKARNQYEDEIPEIVPVLQSDATGTHTVLMNNKFVTVPSQEGKPEVVQSEMITFLDKLPRSWNEIGYALTVGYSRFQKYNGITFDRLMGVSSCTDSRTPARVVLGATEEDGFRFYALRAPGNSLADKDGKKLTVPARRYLAIAKMLDIDVVHSHHSSCGAMTAADGHLKGTMPTLPAAFQALGADRQKSHSSVMAHGDADKSRLDWYLKQTGIAVGCDADSLGVEQLLTDVKVAKEAGFMRVYEAFLHTAQGQNYLGRPDRKPGESFEKVPVVQAFLPPKPLLVEKKDRSHLFQKHTPA